jgi:hypothetical protein
MHDARTPMVKREVVKDILKQSFASADKLRAARGKAPLSRIDRRKRIKAALKAIP